MGHLEIMHPELAVALFDHFYGLLISALSLFGAVELLLAACLLFGVAKTVTYGALIALHGVTVVVSWRQLMHAWAAVPNHLFIASVPLLGALIAFYLLREHDVISLVPPRLYRANGSREGAVHHVQALGRDRRRRAS
jgi:putative oxidoreductase